MGCVLLVDFSVEERGDFSSGQAAACGVLTLHAPPCTSLRRPAPTHRRPRGYSPPEAWACEQ